MADDENVVELPGFGTLEVAERPDGTVELLSSQLDTWLVSLAPVETLTDEGADRTTAPSAATPVLDALATTFPHLRGVLSRSGDLVVSFSPGLRKGLEDGSLRLMSTSLGAAPTAVSTTTGRIAGTATVVGATGGTAAIGVAALPLVLAGGMAFAATWSQQRWLESSFKGFQQSLDRIETRMRDDDLGRLDAADRLLGLLGPEIVTGEVTGQLRAELAVAHQEADGIYCSRLRFIRRFTTRLEEWQRLSEDGDGRRSAWTPQVVEALGAEADPTVDELVVFFQALLTRARTTAATAAVVARDGDPTTAMRLIEELQSSIRRDYFDIHNRLAALARTPIDAGRWSKLLRRSDGADLEERSLDELKTIEARAFQTARLLAGSVDSNIGRHLPDPDTVLSLPPGRLTAVA